MNSRLANNPQAEGDPKPMKPGDPVGSSGRLLWYAVTWLGTAVAFALLAPFLHMGSAFAGLGLLLVSIVALATQGACLVRRGVFMKVAVVLATPLMVYALFGMVVAIMTAYLYRYPPARPMFRNMFIQHERVLLPIWYVPVPRSDAYGHVLWADFEDNVLVVVVPGVPERGRYGHIKAGHDSTRFYVEDGAKDKYVTIERTKDALIIILPDGEVGRFTLGTGLAEPFYNGRDRKSSENLLRQACEVLDAAEKQRCEAFLAAYHEPASSAS